MHSKALGFVLWPEQDKNNAFEALDSWHQE
jgi:hypothetical protein